MFFKSWPLFATTFQKTKGLDVTCYVVGSYVLVVGVVFVAHGQDHIAWLMVKCADSV